MSRSTMSCLRCFFSPTSTLTGRRMFASTPINAVLRCQETYDMPKPEIDKSGRPRRREATIDVSEGDFRSSPFRRGSRNNTSESQYARHDGRDDSRSTKNAGFERGGGSRPFVKKGGFGLKNPTDGVQEETSRPRNFERAGYGRGEGFDRRASGSRENFVGSDYKRDGVARASYGRGGFGWKESDGREFHARNRAEVHKQDHEQEPGTSRSYRTKEMEGRRYDNGRLLPLPNKPDRSSASHWTPGRSGTRSFHGQDTHNEAISQIAPDEPWAPVKKLTFQAMAGLRALHANDPETFDRHALSQRYGISYDAVTRILRSGYQHRKGQETGEKIQGTKWDMNPGTSRLSPVPAINKAFGKGQ